MVDPNTRQGKRTPVTLKIKFKSETLEQFIERYAVDVSQGGIFIRTKEPLAVGTQMKFEFQLRDASPLIAGEGTVVWTRENDPSRPAIAPGMGVRFDRLADGSQGILERILTEKAKQAPQRPAAETAKPPLFTDTPTRVAPAPMQEALLGKDNGRRRVDDSGHNDSHTPLPKPMPFHSDADEFPDEAFEEATKVRALDELIAQTAEGGLNADEITQRRGNGRSDATVPDPGIERPERPERPERGDHLRPMVLPHGEAQDVPDLPNPPELARPQPRILDTSPSPRIESLPPAIPEPLAKTRLGVEPARARVSSSPPISSAAIPPSGPMGTMGGMGTMGAMGLPPSISQPFSELPPVPSGMRAVAAEQTEPARMPPLRSRSLAPLLILVFLLVAGAGTAVWFLVLRPQQTESRDRPPSGQTDGPGSSVATPGTGSARAGTPPGGTAPGSAAPPGNPSKAELVDTVIGASVDGATVEIPGTDQSGQAPFTAKLEKGKTYKARVSAHGYAISELEIRGGDAKQVAKLVAKPRVLSVASEPSGAAISIDGNSTGATTPRDVDLTAAQAGKKTIRVAIRKSGFRALERTIDLAKFTEEDTRMLFKLDEKLSPAPVVTSRPPSTGSTRSPGPGSDAGSGAGSDGASAPSGGSAQSPGSPGSQGSGSEGPVTSPSGGGGSGSSAEPEPEFNKRQ